jgi:hypothetical protein
MRPLSLYEVIRKVWTTIIAKRINLAWHNEGLLNDAQYGYQLDNGTPMPLLNLNNEIEDAIHNRKTKQVTFWDIRRAFDSISRNLQRLAWTRLGVPRDIAEWFVSLDDDSLTFIGSPLYQEACNLRSPAQLSTDASHISQRPDLAFTAGRGIGQGESASSLLWVAVYDLLLDWIDPRLPHLHTTETIDGVPVLNTFSAEDLGSVLNNAYADDLATVAGGPRAAELQQLQATWISAFCNLSGLSMINPDPTAPSKIKATIVGPPSATPPPPLLIFNVRWKPVQCNVDTTIPTVKYLGVHLDLRHSSDAQYEAVEADLKQRLSHLLHEAGSPQTKIEYIRNKILPIARYTGLVANWTLQQYRALDVPLSAAYRRILALPAKFPGDILYLTKKRCGIQLPCLSDQTQILKWENFQRCLAVGGAPARAVQACLDRVPQEPMDTSSVVRHVCHTQWPSKRRYTARSTVEWLHHSHMLLACRTADTPADHVQHLANMRELEATGRATHLWPVTDARPPQYSELERTAQRAQLWPDPEIWGPEQDMPAIQAFYTDGSYSPQRPTVADILTPESSLRDQGYGSGGIVFAPADPQATPIHIRVTSSESEPGMNAYTWELVTQLIALHLAKYLPTNVVGYSDCKSALARTNRALQTKNDQLATTSAGIFGAALHALADVDNARPMEWVRGHPERDPLRANLHDLHDRGIFTADAIAEADTRSLLARNIHADFVTINFRNIMNEIIPVGQWHIRSSQPGHVPILDDLRTHCDDTRAANYLSKRDGQRAPYWSITGWEFTHKVHQLKSNSFWAAARRALVVFDWLGHGRNLALMATTAPVIERVSKCPHCKQLDSQRHLMLECPHHSHLPTREVARRDQQAIAGALLQRSHYNQHHRHFIQQLCHASWVSDSPHLERIWLGTWTSTTLQQLLPHNCALTRPLAPASRHQYIKLARLLTAPRTPHSIHYYAEHGHHDT